MLQPSTKSSSDIVNFKPQPGRLGRSHICLCLAERAADNPENLKSRSYGLEVTDPFFFWISRSLEEGKYIGMCVSGSVHSGPRPLLLL